MKKYLFWLAFSACVMLGLPWLAVTFAKGSAGMAVCFFLFFAINPAFFAVLGAFAGIHSKTLWSLPILSARRFLAGVWIFFAPGETAFYLYASAYLILGLVAMGIAAWIKKRSARG